MTYLAVVSWDEAGRVTKYQDYPTEAEAEAHVARSGGFVAPHPGGGFGDWLCDGETVINSPPPGPTAEQIAAEKAGKAAACLATPQNKTILDALWEMHRAVRGEIALPDETKAQYAGRLKALWASNEP